MSFADKFRTPAIRPASNATARHCAVPLMLVPASDDAKESRNPSLTLFALAGLTTLFRLRSSVTPHLLVHQRSTPRGGHACGEPLAPPTHALRPLHSFALFTLTPHATTTHTTHTTRHHHSHHSLHTPLRLTTTPPPPTPLRTPPRQLTPPPLIPLRTARVQSILGSSGAFSEDNSDQCTYVIGNEDHTLGNSLRYTIMKE
jgi:hypothetical protein